MEVQNIFKWILSDAPVVKESKLSAQMANFQGSAVVLPLNETVGREGGKKKGNSLAKSPCPLGVSDGSIGQSAAAFSIPEVIWSVSVCARARACAHVYAHC